MPATVTKSETVNFEASARGVSGATLTVAVAFGCDDAKTVDDFAKVYEKIARGWDEVDWSGMGPLPPGAKAEDVLAALVSAALGFVDGDEGKKDKAKKIGMLK